MKNKINNLLYHTLILTSLLYYIVNVNNILIIYIILMIEIFKT